MKLGEQLLYNNFRIYIWLHVKGISVHMAATLRATWALLFLPTWPAAVDRTLLLDERSLFLK